MITDIEREKIGKLQELFPDNDLCLAEKFTMDRSESKPHIEFKNKKNKWCSLVITPDSTVDFLAKQIRVFV